MSNFIGNDGEERRENARWQRMLQWLVDEHGMAGDEVNLRVVGRRAQDTGGRGLFALKSCQPSTTLFTIPAKAMITVKTLSTIYPSKTLQVLNPVQLLSMHMFLHRPTGDEDSGDPVFGPYISTLPRDFGSHPLTWMLASTTKHALHEVLTSSLPPASHAALQTIYTRFWEDWKAVCEYLKASPAVVMLSSKHDVKQSQFDTSSRHLQDHFLWAWLNLNTRCIYYRLNVDQSAQENMAMCPILDFANHASLNSHIIPVMPNSLFSPVPGSRKSGKKTATMGGDYMFISSGRSIQEGDELFLQYGAHPNRKLFIEYGFVNVFNEGNCLGGDFIGEVDLQDILEEMFEKRGGSVGRWMKGVLEEEGYWGDWTVHSSPTPAHPSYRLMAALRLYHIVPESTHSVPRNAEELVDAWRRVLIGQEERVSEANEQAWRKSLLRICEEIIGRANGGMENLEGELTTLKTKRTPGWLDWMAGNIQLLWREELEVAEAVTISVRSGEEF
ncbi:SET domain-containing protein [Irpex rosettiformis]|uniref:SET domain-containing protein n=1 Tax=Irpex rosettiformis TaxID=378272 RepID=A0ACB8UH98_9APHY|nr:SET domain-containing protein [Irpex rosettiformis]